MLSLYLIANAIADRLSSVVTIHGLLWFVNIKNSVWMVGAFTVQLFTKTFHWLAQARVEHVGRTEGTTIVQHLKLFALQVSHSTICINIVHLLYDSLSQKAC
jgi:hypothetical protein